MSYAFWRKQRDKANARTETKIQAKTVEEFDMTHGLATPAPREPEEHLTGNIGTLMTALEKVSAANDGNAPCLRIYGDWSWDLIDLEDDQWLMGGKNIYEAFARILRDYRKYAKIQHDIKNTTQKKLVIMREIRLND